MAHIETFDALALHLLPMFLDRSGAGIVTPGFLAGGTVKRENWKRVLNAVFYAPLMRRSMQEFLSSPAKPNQKLFDYYTSQLEFMRGYIERFGHESLLAEFSPERDMTHLLMAQRTSQAQVIECLAMLERNPRFLVTLAHMQNFYCDYIARLEASMKPLIPKPDKTAPPSDEQTDELRMAIIFQRLRNVVSGNQSLFIGVMGFQFMLIHQTLAKRDGRPEGEMIFQDFMAFDRFTRTRKLFVQQGDQCPWSDAYHLGMSDRGVDANGKLMNLSGVQLWRLHQHAEPIAATMHSELREDILRAGMMLSQVIAERARKPKCPYHASNG